MTTSSDKPVSYIAAGAPSVIKAGGVANLDLPILNLATNESSFGASPLALEAIQKRASDPHRYPDPSSTDLRNAIGNAFDLDPALITCGNGSEEVIDGIARRIGAFDNLLYYELLPYHALGQDKSASLGLTPDNTFTTPGAARMQALADVARRHVADVRPHAHSRRPA